MQQSPLASVLKLDLLKLSDMNLFWRCLDNNWEMIN